ncbi:homeodomain-interacting protein kinase 1-like [Acanthochromis polyacanthus]|uniref:homeodomain-interacting protein kinase 1-like n=1 Tax=Acanthochromis polyacanthus TaxID=80966 RepID=UPI0022342452|nr:homeodomain-interacting protein kinase 1-like [Acanthochromis polyacanthus]
MARMMTQNCLFGSDSEYGTLRHMIHLLGLPPQYLIDAGRRSRLFFQRMPNGWWRLKTPIDYFGTDLVYSYHTVYKFDSLDEMKTVCSETDNPAEADERRECIELLKAMLQWDEDDRITPSGILNHPFITKSYLRSSSPTSSCDEPRPATSLSIMVKPADPKNRINLTGLPDEGSDLKSSEYEDSDNADTETARIVMMKTLRSVRRAEEDKEEELLPTRLLLDKEDVLLLRCVRCDELSSTDGLDSHFGLTVPDFSILRWVYCSLLF